MIYFHGWLANIHLSVARLVLDLSLYIFIDDPTASSLQPVSMLVSVDTCGMSASIMSHSQFCLLACDWAHIFNRPNHSQGMRSQAVYQFKTQQPPAASILVSVDVCSTLIIIMSHSPYCLLVIGHIYFIGPELARLLISGCIRIEDPTTSSLSACSYLSIHVACLSV